MPWYTKQGNKVGCAGDGAFLTAQFLRLTHSWHDLRQYEPHSFYDFTIETYFFIFPMAVFF